MACIYDLKHIQTLTATLIIVETSWASSSTKTVKYDTKTVERHSGEMLLCPSKYTIFEMFSNEEYLRKVLKREKFDKMLRESQGSKNIRNTRAHILLR